MLRIAASAVAKLFAYKNGALILVQGGFSATLMVALNTLIKDTEPKKIILAIAVYVFGWALYFLFSILDLLTGLWNAKYQNSITENPEKSYIKTYKLYATMWKGFGITLFGLMIMGTCVLSAIMGGEYIFDFILWCSATFWLMASAFEFRSIGQNIEARVGKLFAIFAFIDPLINFAQKSIILKAKKSINSLEDAPEKSEENENSN